MVADFKTGEVEITFHSVDLVTVARRPGKIKSEDGRFFHVIDITLSDGGKNQRIVVLGAENTDEGEPVRLAVHRGDYCSRFDL